MTAETLRDAAIHGFLALLSERPFSAIAMADVAQKAGLPLSELRAGFGDMFDLLEGFTRMVDRHVLAEGVSDGEALAEESAQERLFEVLMRRLDALEPHKAAVRQLVASARRDPRLALRLLKISERSQRWMLAAAGIDCTGIEGSIRAKGLVGLFARVLDVWLHDEDPGLSRTMAMLDQELRRGDKLLGMLDDIAFIAMPWRARRKPRADEARPAPSQEAQAPSA